MGGAVTLRALLALGDEVRGASIWSSSSASLSDEAESDPAGFLGDLETPLNIHHATGDPVTPYAWSAALHEELSGLGRTAALYSYPSSDHLFTGDDIQRAIDRDSLFFDQLAD
jgi:dienelactone hydrolase